MLNVKDCIFAKFDNLTLNYSIIIKAICDSTAGLTSTYWHFPRWIANHWRRIRGRSTALRINPSANRAAMVKATGNYKSRKRKQRKDELLISPGVILALDPRCCLRPIRFSIPRSSRNSFHIYEADRLVKEAILIYLWSEKHFFNLTRNLFNAFNKRRS